MNYFHTNFFDAEMSKNDALFKVKINLLFNSIKFLEAEYPSFRSWFYGKVVPEIKSNQRIIISKDSFLGKTVGLAIIKNTHYEKKICTLWVNDDFQSKGIGSDLLDISRSILEMEKPLITVSESRIEQFTPIFEKYDFELFDCYKSYYKCGLTELAFNGLLDSHSEKSEPFLIHQNQPYEINRPYE